MKNITRVLVPLLAILLVTGCGKKKGKEAQTMSPRDYGLVTKRFEKQFPDRISGHLEALATNIDEYSDAQLEEQFAGIRKDIHKLLDEVCKHYDFTAAMLDATHKEATGRSYTEQLDARLDEIFDRVKRKAPYKDLVWGKSEEPKGASQNLTYLAKATASSTLPASKHADYIPANVLDGLSSTCWAEGADNNGIGEWIKLTFPSEVTVTRIGIIPGYDWYADDEIGDRFSINLRAKRIKLEFSDGSSQIINPQDSRRLQYFDLSEVQTRFVRLVVENVHSANAKWQDLCISEVEIQGIP
jgi:hypothetical protein